MNVQNNHLNNMKKFKLSYSSICDYKQCPKCFELKHIKKLQPEFKDNIYTCFGSSTHKVIEDTLKNEKILELNEVLNMFPDLFIKNLDKVENKELIIIPQWLETGKNCLTYFYNNYYKQIKPNFIAAEQYFSYNIKDNIYFNGLIDVIIKDGNNIKILDWKTGKYSKSVEQLTYYALVMQKLYGVMTNSIDYIYLKVNKNNALEINQEILDETEFELNDIINKITLTTKFEKNFSSQCKYCNMKEFCTEN